MVVKELEVKVLEDPIDIEALDLKQFEEIKAIAFKGKEGSDHDYMNNRHSCGWSVCHCATYGCD